MGLDEAENMTADRAPVSVIIPMFNSAGTIERALGSVAEQLLLPSEVFVVDDASSDQSREIVTRWDNPAISVTLIAHSTNLGPSASRNSAWAQSTGDFLAFLDADDAWHPEKLSIQYKFMTENAAIVLCGHSYDIYKDTFNWSHIENERGYKTFDFKDFLIRNRLSTPTVMVKREIIERFTESQRYSEDYLLWLEIVRRHGHAYFLDLPLTRLFKPAVGKTGLSSKTNPMYLGELSTMISLFRRDHLGFWQMTASIMWLTAKYVRRRIQIAFAKILRFTNMAA